MNVTFRTYVEWQESSIDAETEMEVIPRVGDFVSLSGLEIRNYTDGDEFAHQDSCIITRVTWYPPIMDSEHDDDKETSVSIECRPGTDVEIYGRELSNNTIRANADLIAAAPDLLEALKAFAPYDGDQRDPNRPDLIAARKAIAKAEGNKS